jgi:uncharacterized protein
MKLHEHIPQRMNLIGRYDAGGVQVNGRAFQRPLIVAPGFLHTEWIADAPSLAIEALAPVWTLEPRLLLLGGGSFSQPQLKALRQGLAARQVALEAMDLGAACRTYNVLAQEERAVAALLFPD